jgi:hypothetical protein
VLASLNDNVSLPAVTTTTIVWDNVLLNSNSSYVGGGDFTVRENHAWEFHLVLIGEEGSWAVRMNIAGTTDYQDYYIPNPQGNESHDLHFSFYNAAALGFGTTTVSFDIYNNSLTNGVLLGVSGTPYITYITARRIL